MALNRNRIQIDDEGATIFANGLSGNVIFKEHEITNITESPITLTELEISNTDVGAEIE
jgi:hypothetical protein